MGEAARSGLELNWHFPKDGEAAFVLSTRDREVGWLRLDDESGRGATGEWEGRRWRFAYEPSFHRCVTVQPEGSEECAAVLTCQPGGRGGNATLASGTRYTWTREHFWSSVWCFRSGDTAGVCVSQRPGPMVAGGAVRVRPDTHAEDIPVLVLLGWYLRVLEFARLSGSICLGG